jgi:hypothetical protein
VQANAGFNTIAPPPIAADVKNSLRFMVTIFRKKIQNSALKWLKICFLSKIDYICHS